ncbi:MAG: glycosyltransferase [Candidatus Hydrogenedentes bacterium]|nr:glycosyltransferase [Candidatus Hydrogenedentota bacterium]
MPSDAPLLSVVIPVFNEVGTLEELFRRLTDTLSRQPGGYEIIAVDDGSTDGSRQALRDWHSRDPRIRVVFLSRNFGQSPALYAGFSRARGQYVAMMDADLQNYPEDIPRLVAKLEEGYDMVSGWRANRKDSFFRTGASKLLNRYINSVTRVALNDYGCALKAFRRELVDHMLSLTHRCRYLPVDAAALGGRVAEIEVRHDQRGHGESKYGLLKLVRTAFDLITSITAAPLQFIGLLGWFFALIGFCMSLRVAYVRVTVGDLEHMATVVAIFFFLSGCQMVATGVMCEYISRIYIEVQAKPYFVIQEELE